MEVIEQIKTITTPVYNTQRFDPLDELEDELSAALSIYWSTAARILRKSGVELLDPPDGYFSLEKNFFSALFLYSYHRAGIARSRRVTYAAVNQCLRGMVTGCDNILDDEYKKTLETDLPEQGVRFRSVVDIMVSDRVFFEILLDKFKKEEISYSKVLEANAASIKALIRSGAQEASEENGNSSILQPRQVLAAVHHYKTGLLFQCPWAIPRVLEDCGQGKVDAIMQALYQIGMGCQVMDDMVDLASDLQRQRHNYVASVIYHELDSNHRQWLNSYKSTDPGAKGETDFLLRFPEAISIAKITAYKFLEEGLHSLFDPDHQFFVEPAISFLSKRIGADRLMT
ncbi:MAG: polyprenyl synthetase family protein [Desulfobacterales bacterium]|jgi:hypothetical protein